MIRWGRGEVGCFESSELAHLDYALVSTTYAAQGKSAERVIGALDRYVGRESFYVAVSRVKHDLKLYASEDLDRLIERVERSRAKENPSDIKLPETTLSIQSSFMQMAGVASTENGVSKLSSFPPKEHFGQKTAKQGGLER